MEGIPWNLRGRCISRDPARVCCQNRGGRGGDCYRASRESLSYLLHSTLCDTQLHVFLFFSLMELGLHSLVLPPKKNSGLRLLTFHSFAKWPLLPAQSSITEVGLCKRAHCTLSRSLWKFLAQFPHFSSFHLLSNLVLISPPFINDRTLILGGKTKRCLFDWFEQP